MKELAYMSAMALAKAIKSGELSAVEVTDFFIDRIEKRNPSLNAFVYTNFEHARREAAERDKRLRAGDAVGDLFGVPTALKDFLPGYPGWQGTNGGIRALTGPDPCYSNYALNTEKAGAVILGKTNAPSMAYRGTTDNYMFGATGNPFNTAYNPGGSSGGSAAAVADGMIPVAEGTDGGGSIRIPAAWCGVFGYKASVGTIPSVSRPDAFGDSHPYTFDGVLARTVEDSALVLNQMAYFDPMDPLSIEYPKRNFLEALKQPLKGWRIGFTTDFGIFPVEKEIADMVTVCARRFEEAGAYVEPIEFHFKRDQYELSQIWCKEICVTTIGVVERLKKVGIDLLGAQRRDIPPTLANALEKAKTDTVLDLIAYDEGRTEVYDELQKKFASYDLIVSPTMACGPVQNSDNGDTLGPEEINGVKVDPSIGYCMTYFCNFTGHPAASVPMGLMKNGMPAGMQIIGRRFHDMDVLAASAAFEEIQPWKHIYSQVENRTL